MATTPLFVADDATLKSKLRLTGIGTGSDTEEILEQAVLDTRVEIYSRLGTSRTNELVATAFAENPTSEAAVLRAMCNSLEIKMVRLRLLDVLPVLFMDNSGIEADIINEDATFRALQPDQLDTMRAECKAQIEKYIALLTGAETLGSIPQSQAFVTERQEPFAYPGGSLAGDNDRLWGDANRRVEDEDGNG